MQSPRLIRFSGRRALLCWRRWATPRRKPGAGRTSTTESRQGRDSPSLVRLVFIPGHCCDHGSHRLSSSRKASALSNSETQYSFNSTWLVWLGQRAGNVIAVVTVCRPEEGLFGCPHKGEGDLQYLQFLSRHLVQRSSSSPAFRPNKFLSITVLSV